MHVMHCIAYTICKQTFHIVCFVHVTLFASYSVGHEFHVAARQTVEHFIIIIIHTIRTNEHIKKKKNVVILSYRTKRSRNSKNQNKKKTNHENCHGFIRFLDLQKLKSSSYFHCQSFVERFSLKSLTLRLQFVLKPQF